MKATKTNIIIPLFLSTVFFSACEKKITDNYVALVENIPITEYEFTMRYNFNPYLTKQYDENEAKKIVLSSLIAEKLLAIESINSTGLNDDIQSRIDQHKREAMIEQFRRDSVENKINITDSELRNEYQKALKEITIKFVAFQSQDKAYQVKQNILTGKSFDQAVKNYMTEQGWGDESIPEKTIKWNTESYELEKTLYELKPGDISNPININGDYYLIKIKDIKSTQNPSEADFRDRLPALKDYLIKEKVKIKYTNFFKNQIEPIMGRADWQKLEYAFDVITNEIKFDKNESQLNPLPKDKGLSDEIYLNYQARQSQLENMIVIEFPDQSNWDFKKLIYVLKYGPFAFNYKNKTAFKKSFKYNIQLALEYNAVYQLAEKAGYGQNNNVLQDTQIWESYYRANNFRHNILRKAELNKFPADSELFVNNAQFTPRELFRLNFIDQYLQTILKVHNIKINKKKYDTLNLEKTDMVVMKKHFANRMVIPLTEPLSSLPKWQNAIYEIFKKYGIT